MLVRQKQMSAAMIDVCQKTFRAQRMMCAYKSDEDNCENVFSNSGNSSNTDSSDNE